MVSLADPSSVLLGELLGEPDKLASLPLTRLRAATPLDPGTVLFEARLLYSFSVPNIASSFGEHISSQGTHVSSPRSFVIKRLAPAKVFLSRCTISQACCAILVKMGEVYAIDDEGCFGSLAGDVKGMSKSNDDSVR